MKVSNLSFKVWINKLSIIENKNHKTCIVWNHLLMKNILDRPSLAKTLKPPAANPRTARGNPSVWTSMPANAEECTTWTTPSTSCAPSSPTRTPPPCGSSPRSPLCSWRRTTSWCRPTRWRRWRGWLHICRGLVAGPPLLWHHQASTCRASRQPPSFCSSSRRYKRRTLRGGMVEAPGIRGRPCEKQKLFLISRAEIFHCHQIFYFNLCSTGMFFFF